MTGHEAAEARRLGDSLTAQLNRIETMADAEKDAALKAYTVVSFLYTLALSDADARYSAPGAS